MSIDYNTEDDSQTKQKWKKCERLGYGITAPLPLTAKQKYITVDIAKVKRDAEKEMMIEMMRKCENGA